MTSEASASTPVPDVTFTAFGKQGVENEQFNAPLGMAFNRDKTEIFVADRDNNRVQVLTYDRETGKLTFKHTIDKISDVRGGGTIGFGKPMGVAVGQYKDSTDKDLNVLIVAVPTANQIYLFNCFDPYNYMGSLDMTSPVSVAIDKDYTIFAYDSSNCRIGTIDRARTNKYICEKTIENDPNNLGDWGILAFDKEGNLVVADEANHRVQVLKSSNGAHIRTITGGDQLKLPCGIAFTEDGKNIIIVDYGNDQVHVLTYADGKIVKSFGSTKGNDLGQFNGPYGVLVDDETGHIIVSEEGGHRIQVIHNALPKKSVKVEVKPLTSSKKSKYPGLEVAIREAITAFITSEGLGAEYKGLLEQLNKKIDEDRTRVNDPDSELARLLIKVTKKVGSKGKKEKTTTTKKLETKLESRQLPKEQVKTIITKHEKDAIFVVTGGSFNPPHNGHIGMFQKAYEALKDKGKKVYGVMVPAEDSWIEGKLCKEEHPDTITEVRKCTPAELTDKRSQAAIESKRIKVTQRVNLCKLSCDSYEWPDKSKFGAENMIVVNQSADGEEFTSAENTYYLCGSDYYKDVESIKYICVLRKGDTRAGNNLVRKGKAGKTSVPIKATDIIIEGSDIDNDASSTMLRNILTKIHNARIGEMYDAGEPITKKLLTKQVYCQLINMKYIVVDTEKCKSILVLLACGGSNDTDIKLRGITGVTTDGGRSLCNIGSMCYMNAALQLFYSMPDFRNAIKTPTNPLTEYLNAMDGGVSCDQARQLARALYDLAQGGAGGNAFTTRSFNNQEDASELITTVLSAIVFDTSKDSMRFNSSTALVYTGSEDIKTACIQLDENALKIVPEPEKPTLVSLRPLFPGDTLLLPVTDGANTLTTFEQVFDAYRNSSTDREATVDDSSIALAGNNLTDPNGIIFSLPGCMMTKITKDAESKPFKVLKPLCNPLIGVENSSSDHKPYKLTQLKDKTYISLGPTQKYFIVILKRTISDGKEGQIKLKHAVDLENATINIGDRQFTITGCVCHHGDSPNSGHYTYVEFTNGKPTTVYDDHNIVKYATYLETVDRNRTVDTEGYVLLFERT